MISDAGSSQNKKQKQPDESSSFDEDKGAGTLIECGIIMPISSIGEYPSDHWARVKTIIDKAVRDAGYRPRLVSESDAIGIIQSEIVTNIYSDEIIVCDVSAKNPNVMFELGLRLAFDKPVVVVKDEKTDYSFDTSPIKHIPYSSDLRFDLVETFQRELSKAINATAKKSKEDPEYSPFLKSFGRFVPRKLTESEVDGYEYLSKKIDDIEAILLSSIKRQERSDQASLLNFMRHSQSGVLGEAYSSAWERYVLSKMVDKESNKSNKPPEEQA